MTSEFLNPTGSWKMDAKSTGLLGSTGCVLPEWPPTTWAFVPPETTTEPHDRFAPRP
jgi:hypothetical protein